MKKAITLFLTAVLLTLSLLSCDDSGRLDFTGLDNEELYGTLSAIAANPGDYTGREVRISANTSVVYSFTQNKVLSNVQIAHDPNKCSDAYSKIITHDGTYTGIGATAVIDGIFGDGYIDVTGLKVNSSLPAPALDTLGMDPSELNEYITAYTKDHLTSAEKGKTIALVGHYTMVNGYRYLMGLNGQGEPTWTIELGEVADGIKLPVQNGNYINPVYIYGELSYYTEGTNTYACINVTAAQKVVGVMQ